MDHPSLPPHRSSAPGKLILCGEHAVVYGCPAIAVPLHNVRAYAHVAPGSPGCGVSFNAPDLQAAWLLDEHPDDPLSELVQATLRCLNVDPLSVDLSISITSDIPIAGGMGSGAAVATALVRALSNYFGRMLSRAEVSDLVFCSEQRYHGTPSGIDNTVIAYEQALWFVRPKADPLCALTSELRSPVSVIEPVEIAAPLTLVLGDTGIRSETRLPVGEVRRRWQADPVRYEALFAEIGEHVHRIRSALAIGDILTLGTLLNANQTLLEEIGVSSPELEKLITKARDAGALGAKLSGGGWGGIMFALTEPSFATAVASALRDAGAAKVMETHVPVALIEDNP